MLVEQDFILTQKVDSECKDFKVILNASVTMQHKIVVLDICIRKWKRREMLETETQELHGEV